jgi:3-dehydroquinate synthase
LVGSFYPPKTVLIDPQLLATLPPRVFSDGMAEVIKYGAIRDENLFETLETTNIGDVLLPVIARCVEIKKEIVENDEFDTGERMLLNFGHTYGHVVENFFDYKKFTHGEAVAVGMLRITAKTEESGITQAGTTDRLARLLRKYNLLFENVAIDRDTAKEILFLDKKSSSKQIQYVVLERIGAAKTAAYDKADTFLLEP